MDFSSEIKKIRKEAMLSQKEFAIEIGVSFSSVNRWENQKTIPSYKAVRLIESFCKNERINAEACIREWKKTL